MFKIASSASYWFPVDIHFRTESGKVEVRKVECKFKRLTQPELEDLLNPLTPKKTDRQLLDDVWLDWKGVGDDEGNPAEFTPSAKDAFLAIIPTQPTIVKAFFASMQQQARAGN